MRVKIRHIILVVVMSVCCFATWAQLPDDLRTEQIYLAPEKLWFDAGDTIRVNGVVTSQARNHITPYSRILYLELISRQDSVLIRQRLSCDSLGQFTTIIPTDGLFVKGMYYLRAYTKLMRNFNNEGYAYAPLVCGDRPINDSHSLHNVQCHISPEGGKLAAGELQRLVIVLQSMSGYPITDRTIYLENESGEVVASAKTSLSGTASITYLPQWGDHYRITIDGIEASEQSFAVPDAEPGAVKVSASLNYNIISYDVHNMPSDTAGWHIYTYDRQNGLLNYGAVRPSGAIRLTYAPNTATILLADTAMNVMAEYTALQRKQSGADFTDTIMPLPSGTEVDVRQLCALSDTAGVVMCRFVSCDELWAPTAEDALLYENEYASTLPFPYSSWKQSPRQRQADLQAWLSTARLARLNLKEAVTKGKSIYEYMPEMVITLSGTALMQNWHPYKNGRIIAYRTDNNCVYDTIVQKDGRFCIPVDNFEEGTDFFVQYISKREKPVKAELRFDDDVFPAPSAGGKKWAYAHQYALSEASIGSFANLEKYNLPEITVKARVHVDKRHETERFYGTNYKSQATIDEKNYITLYDILRDIPALIVRRAGSRYALGTKRGVSAGLIPIDDNDGDGVADRKNATSLPLLIDGSRYDGGQLDFAMEMSAKEIESVEFLQPWQALAVTFGALHGAVVVKTRNYHGEIKRPSLGTYYRPMGIYRVAEVQERLLTPSRPGNYRLIVDVINADGVHTYNSTVSVK